MKGIKLEVSDEVLEFLSKQGFNPEYGARPLKRLIQNRILNKVAEFIISRRVENGGIVKVAMRGDEPTIELKKSYTVRGGKRTNEYTQTV